MQFLVFMLLLRLYEALLQCQAPRSMLFLLQSASLCCTLLTLMSDSAEYFWDSMALLIAETLHFILRLAALHIKGHKESLWLCQILVATFLLAAECGCWILQSLGLGLGTLGVLCIHCFDVFAEGAPVTIVFAGTLGPRLAQ